MLARLMLLAVLMLPLSSLSAEKKCCDFLKDWTAALKANNLGKIMALYENTEKMVAVDSQGKTHWGAEGIRAMYKQAFDEVKLLEVTVSSEKFREEKDWVVAYFQYQALVQVKAQKNKFRLQAQATMFLRKHQGGWVIVSEHFSPIAGVPRIQPVK